MSASPLTPTNRRFALLSRLFLSLKRAGRIIDVEWFQQNSDYAHSMLELAEALEDSGINELVAKLRAEMPNLLSRETHQTQPVPNKLHEADESAGDRYVGSLR